MTEANINLMKQLILNGADKHPGANFIQQRQTNIRKWVCLPSKGGGGGGGTTLFDLNWYACAAEQGMIKDVKT